MLIYQSIPYNLYDTQVAGIIGLGVGEEPMYIMPIGVPKTPYRTSFEEIARFIEGRRDR